MRHPEQQPDEIYMGITEPRFFHVYGWKTKRMGITSFNWGGDVPSSAEYLPWFVKRSEVEVALAKEKDESRADVYRNMLNWDKDNV